MTELARIVLMWVSLIAGLIAWFAFCFAYQAPAHAGTVPAHNRATGGVVTVHDPRRADLDDWYGSLRRPGVQPPSFTSCCSKTDCHTTEAELRGADWWARIGVRQANGEWDLRDWVKVPAHVVLQRHDNPTGEGVICHSSAWRAVGSEQTLDAKNVTIFCFVPPVQS
jgi:hypothetical protein